MSAHTPGPWEIAPHSDDEERLNIVSEYSCSPGRETAHWIAECDLQEGIEENAANARLIAAAPDLLEALRDAYQFLSDFDGRENEGLEGSLTQRCRQVIAKAEGR